MHARKLADGAIQLACVANHHAGHAGMFALGAILFARDARMLALEAFNPARGTFAPPRARCEVRPTDIRLAYVGPQKGHNQAQACPSKHPDGYREVPF